MEVTISSATAFTLSLSSSLVSRPSSATYLSSNFSLFNGTALLTHRRNRANQSLIVGGRSRTRENRRMSCNSLFGLGVPELVVIAGVAALVFGPKKLPEVGRSIGKTVKSFQQAAKEFESELKKEPDPALESPVEKAAISQEEEEKEEGKEPSTKESV